MWSAEGGARDDARAAEVLACEAERCRAISEQDWAALDALLDEDFTYTFLSGRTERKDVYLAGLPSRPHGVTDHDLDVRVYGDIAVITGSFVSTTPTGEVANEGTILVVWLRSDRWRAVAFQSTRRVR
jgi:ketosteroid isomerase-like protein